MLRSGSTSYLTVLLLLLSGPGIVWTGTADDQIAGRADDDPPVLELAWDRVQSGIAHVNGSGASDPGHVFFVANNTLYVWDVEKNETRTLDSFMYEIEASPGYYEPMMLRSVEASITSDGLYHVAILGQEPLNNLTASYLVTVLYSPAFSNIYGAMPIGKLDIVNLDIERDLIAAAYEGGTEWENVSTLFWNGGGYNIDTLYTKNHVVAISYNTGWDEYAVSAMYSRTDISTFYTDDGLGWSGTSPDWRTYSGWTVIDMAVDHYFNSDDLRFSVRLLLEQHETGSKRVVLDLGYREMGLFGDGETYDIPFPGDLDIIVNDCYIAAAFQGLSNDFSGTPESVFPPDTNIFIMDHEGGYLADMQAYDGVWHTTLDLFEIEGGLVATGFTDGLMWDGTESLVADTIGIDIYGDWSVAELGIDAPSPLYGGDNVTIGYLLNSTAGICNASCMEGAVAYVMVDGVELENRTLVAGTDPQQRYTNWTASAGSHNITVRLTVLNDTDRTNDTLSVIVDVDTIPDLDITNVTIAPDHVHSGETSRFLMDIVNHGGNATNYTVEFYFENIKYEARKVQDHGAGDTVSVNFSRAAAMDPHTVTKTLRFIVANITPGDSDLSNNEATVDWHIVGRDISLKVTSPMPGDDVNHLIDIAGRLNDPEGEEARVWATLEEVGGSFNLTSMDELVFDDFALAIDISDAPANSYELTVHAAGTFGRNASVSVGVTVLNGVHWKMLDPIEGSYGIKETDSLNITAIAGDRGTLDERTTVWTIDGRPASDFSFVKMIGNTLSLVTGHDDAGSYYVQGTVEGRFGEAVQANWTLVIENVNRAPVLNGTVPGTGTVDIGPNDVANFTVDAFDPDGDIIELTWRWKGQVFHGYNISIMPGTVGVQSLELVISDGQDEIALEWTLNVTGPKDPGPDPRPETGPMVLLEDADLMIPALLVVIMVLIAIIAAILQQWMTTIKRREEAKLIAQKGRRRVR